MVKSLSHQINKEAFKPMRFMEVCGGHTHSLRKFGIPALLPDCVKLISGPGCPVCVTNYSFIDQSLELLQKPNIIICTYGDLIRVPGTKTSLEREMALGKRVSIVLSSLQALELAARNPSMEVVFLGIGFETTAPSTAAAILEARKRGVDNFSMYSAHKIMSPAMKALTSCNIILDGFICPGHVSTIAGSGMYRFLAEDHGLACVVSGFEPVDLMQSILMLIRQTNSEKPSVEIQYKRAVKPEGNKRALSMMDNVFSLKDDWWRGLGIIPESGLGISEKYSDFDAVRRFDLKDVEAPEPKGCSCGEILRGAKKPEDCQLFSKICNPAHPIGACMVSPEGACNASFRYG